MAYPETIMVTKRVPFFLGLFIALFLLANSLAHAAGITVGSGSTLTFGDGTTLTTSDDIHNSGTLAVTTGTIKVGGSWTNSGVFTAGSGTVNFIDGQPLVHISGESSFWNFGATTTAGKQINFETGRTQTVGNLLKLLGVCPNPRLVLRSGTPGQRAYIDLLAIGTQDIYAVNVQDHEATGQWLAPSAPASICSADSGNNWRWFQLQADLSISKSDSPDPVSVGQNLVYTINVSNNGPADATGVTVTDTLPPGVTFVSVTPSQGCSNVNATVTCSLGNLSNGASTTVMVNVIPATAGTITNTVTVSGIESDPLPANNTTTASTTVIPASPSNADLSLTKTDSPDPVIVGSNVTYTIIVTNHGPSTANGVRITDSLPSNVNLVSADSSQGSCAGIATVICNIGTLTNGVSTTVTIVVKTNAVGMLSNGACASANETDLNPDNDCASQDTTVVVASRLKNISTRAMVLTGSNRMIAGFIVYGTAPETIVMRARGQSMSGPPFNLSGTLLNPRICLFSGSTKIACNDDWEIPDPLCVSPASGCMILPPNDLLSPCTPNPGQSVEPPGCHRESAFKVTVPPGNYSAIVEGVGGTTGRGLVEAFDVDTEALSWLHNISTRAIVLTGADRVIGGFIVNGVDPKTVKIRARGPSMSGAPFNLTGTLQNPTICLYSGSTKIACNDDWEIPDPLCISPALACTILPPNDPLSPCAPNPGQSVEPPGCHRESAFKVTLPTGNYSAIMQGVGGGTGTGLVEVFEDP